jgi:hypothetical protein
MITFPELESCEVIERDRFTPMIPRVVIAVTPITIPSAARRDRRRCLLTLLMERLMNMSWTKDSLPKHYPVLFQSDPFSWPLARWDNPQSPFS